MITGTSLPGASASISFPPWPGGDSSRRGPLGSGCADHPPVDLLRNNNPAPRTAMSITDARPCHHLRVLILLILLFKLEGVKGGQGFVHQLFCHLQHRAPWEQFRQAAPRCAAGSAPAAPAALPGWQAASAGLFVVRTEDHRLERRSRPDRGSVVQLALLLPGPGLLLSS